MNFSLLVLIIAILASATIDCEVCQTEACKKLSKELEITMDKKVDPCDDFGSHICGNYDKLYSIPAGENYFDSVLKMDLEINKELKDLLDKQPSVDNDDARTKAKIFYQSCFDMKKRDEKTKTTITQLAQKMNKENSYEANLINVLRSGLTTRLIGIDYLEDPENPEYFILNIAKPELILSEDSLQSSDSDMGKKQIHNYKKYMNSILDELGMWKSDRCFIDAIFILSIKIAKALPSIVDQYDPKKFSNRITIKDLQSKCPQISWRNLFNSLLKGTGKTTEDNNIVMVFSLTYLDGLCSILKEYNSDPIKKRILDMDLQWALINSVVQLGTENLMKISNQLGKDDFGSSGKKELMELCRDLTSKTFVDIMGHMYVNGFFQATQRKNIETLIASELKSFANIIENSTWMDSQTKKAALEKLSLSKYKIGYSDSLLSVTKLNKDNEKVTMVVDAFMQNFIDYKANNFIIKMKKFNEKIPDDHWPLLIHQVNAFSLPSTNTLYFPAAILRYPFYDIGLPMSFNFGAIGTAVGHEIIHLFDPQGSKYDGKGFLRDWWTNSSSGEFSKKSGCILKQYGGYSYGDQKLLSEQTLDEDVSDNGGMRIAYMAFFSSNKKEEYPTLPELDFTPEQLFFVAWARAFCTLYTNESLVYNIKNGIHTVGKHRINGPMSNMPEFSEAFKCDNSKTMNRLEKCLVW